MKISIDYDGCMWSHMEFFRSFMWAMIEQGHEVGCLSDHPEGTYEADRDLMVKRGFPTLDFWIGRKEGDTRHPSEIKAEAIIAAEIDLHFDDMDYGDPLSIGIFQRKLGPNFYKVMWVTGREPGDVHYE